MADEVFRICRFCDGTGQMQIAGGEPPGLSYVDCIYCGATGKETWGTVAEEYTYTYKIAENTDIGEYNALSDANKQIYRDITGMGIVDLTDGTIVRATLWVLFDAQSTTRANLITMLGE